ncbi:MAG: accB, partial [Rhizorhabdus sp.]|nr:accB [Rhizorhabdus sp.]
MSEQSQGSAMQVDPELVRQLAVLLDETNLTEIEVQDGDRKIRVARNIAVAAAAPVYAPAPAAAVPAPAAPIAVEAAADHPGTVKSPMVGTVYLSAEPGARQFAAPGDKVTVGQTLLIVEAMKVMNSMLASEIATLAWSVNAFRSLARASHAAPSGAC